MANLTRTLGRRAHIQEYSSAARLARYILCATIVKPNQSGVEEDLPGFETLSQPRTSSRQHNNDSRQQRRRRLAADKTDKEEATTRRGTQASRKNDKRQTTTMRLSRNLQWKVSISSLLLTSMAWADNFNYRGTSGDNYGPEDWDRVGCSDLDNCVSSDMQADVPWRSKRVSMILSHFVLCSIR